MLKLVALAVDDAVGCVDVKNMCREIGERMVISRLGGEKGRPT